MQETDSFYLHTLVEKLHEDTWDNDLLSGTFNHLFHNVLTPMERQITELKVGQNSDKDIADIVGIGVKTVQRHCYSIKQCYRTGQRTRVDNYWDVRAMNSFRKQAGEIIAGHVKSEKKVGRILTDLDVILQSIFHLGVEFAKKYYKIKTKKSYKKGAKKR